MNQPQPYFDSLDQLTSLDYAYVPPLKGKALTDFQKAKTFLLSYRGSQDTFNAYRREIERFLQWSQCILKKNITEISREDFEHFLKFCQKPHKSWIGTKNETRFLDRQGKRIPNPKWRPFVATVTKVENRIGKKPDRQNYQLSNKAFRVIFAVISSFYNFLIEENYTQVNPVSLIRQKSKYLISTQEKPTIRRLSELQWGYVLQTAEDLAQIQSEPFERSLFILNALYGMYLRISELTATTRWYPKMCDFARDHENNWWFTVIGKGNKERKIAVSGAMLSALKHWRKYRNLTPLPSPSDKAPLIHKLKNSHQPISSTRYIRALVQEVFDRAILKLKEDNQFDEAEQLMAATVHWLRHTGISDDVKIRPREHVRDDAGHSSSAITDKYIDIELRERHASAKRKKIKPECMETA